MNLDRLRQLLGSEVSLERAWAALNRGDGQAPQATVEALVYGLRRGVNELIKPDAQRRLSELNRDQLEAVCLGVQAFKPNIAPAWSAEDADLLIAAWGKLHGR